MTFLGVLNFRYFLFVWLLAGIFAAQDLCASEVTVKKNQIGDGIYQFTCSSDGYVPNGNSVVIVNDSDVLVFDTFTRPSAARLVLAEIRKLTNKPVRYVVNSHWHPDHWSGNEVYAQAFPDVEIITTEANREHMLNAANAWPPMFKGDLSKQESDFENEVSTGKLSDGTPLTSQRRSEHQARLQQERDFVTEMIAVHRTYPTLTYVDHLTLWHGGREFRFISMTGDATATTVLYLPKEKILMSGDLFAFPEPYYTPPLSQHLASLRRLAQFDVDLIVPGHGPAWRDKEYLNREADLFDSIIQRVHAAERQGLVSVEQVQKAVNVDELLSKFVQNDQELKDFAEYLRLDLLSMVENAYREGRDGEKFPY